MGSGEELVTDVAEGRFDRAEDFVIGQIDQFVGESIQRGLGFAAEGLKDELASLFTIL
jgi:hypothetical protein